MNVKPDKNFAVLVTALPVEFDAVCQLLGAGSAEIGAQGTRYFVATRGGKRVVLFSTGAGNVNAAIEVERAIERYDPRYLIFVGVAGGLKDVHVGDVVAATKIYNYESGKSTTEFLARPQMGESSYHLVQLADELARTSELCARAPSSHGDFMAFVGPIVAGEKVVASLEANEVLVIRNRYSDALALEMEGYGVLRVGYSRENVRMIVIRGVSDLLAGKEKTDASGSQVAASSNAAKFATCMLDRLLQEPQSISEETWDAVERLVVELYPTGPTHGELWNRAGGDLSTVFLGQSGKAAWHSALQQLRMGGGGANLTLKRLVHCVLEDYPNNSALINISKGLS